MSVCGVRLCIHVTRTSNRSLDSDTWHQVLTAKQVLMLWPKDFLLSKFMLSVEYASHVACQNSRMLMHGAYMAVSRSMWKVVEPWSHVFKACWGLHLFFSYKLRLQLYLSLTSVILLGEPLSAGYLIRTACRNRL